MAEVIHQRKQHSRSIEGLDVVTVAVAVAVAVAVVVVKNYYSGRTVVLKV